MIIGEFPVIWKAESLFAKWGFSRIKGRAIVHHEVVNKHGEVYSANGLDFP